MQQKMNCLVIDDEPLAREGMESFISDVPFLSLLASCSTPTQALDKIKNTKPDLLFLDIQMPKMTGLELLQTLHNPPLTIVSTAYSEYAIKSYDLDVIDYLVKPVSFSRFLKAVNKAKDYFDLHHSDAVTEHSGTGQKDYFFIKCDKCFEKIFFDDVQFIQALQNYVVIQTVQKRFITYLTIKSVEGYLPHNKFVRLNKSYVVSLPKIDNIQGNEVHVGSHSFIIGRQHKDDVMKAIGLKMIRRNG